MNRSTLHRLARTALVALLLGPLALAADTTFRVQVPASTPAGDTVYIAGDFQGWDPGSPAYALTPLGGDLWEITLTLPDGVPIQFKFTRGDWGRVEKGPSGEEIANRTHTPVGVETLNLTVATWADGNSTITGHVEQFQHAPFLGGRRCWVYLPPDYFTSAARYPVLYMHDGQNLFDDATSFAGEWEVDEACEALIAAGEIEPLIVVGIENGPNRCTEYTPWPGSTCGGGADAYLQAVRDVLIPEVDQRYRTQTGPENTYMSGSSLGGLVSAYAGWQYDATWGRVAAVSPSYWWAGGAMISFAAAQGRPPLLTRFYQDMGTAEGGITNLRAMRDVAVAQGYVEGVDLLHVEAQGHAHNEFYWSQRVPDLLRFLIDPPAGTALCFCDAAAAPCSNADPDSGCANSTGAGAVLGATGSASVAAQGPDPLVLLAAQARPDKSCVWLQGAAQQQVAFRDGNLCVGNPTIRLPGFGCGPFPIGTLDPSGAIATDDPTYGFDVVAAALCKGDDLAAQAPTTRYYQLWFRDGMGPCGSGSNLTNAVEVGWTP